MSTEDIISARRDAAIQKWTEAVFAMYPFETTGFIRTQRDQFANPVGHATRAAGEQIYDASRAGMSTWRRCTPLWRH